VLISRHLSALAAQLLHAGSDRRKIVSGAGASHGAQLLHTCPDRHEIVGSSGAGHVSSEGFSVFAARQLG
jgi:hypothetical protein